MWKSCGLELVKQEKGICLPASLALREGRCLGHIIYFNISFGLWGSQGEKSGVCSGRSAQGMTMQPIARV